MVLRFEGEGSLLDFGAFSTADFLVGAAVAVGLLVVVNLAARRFHGRIRYGSFEDILRLVAVFVIAAAAIVVVDLAGARCSCPTPWSSAAPSSASPWLPAPLRLAHGLRRRKRPRGDGRPVIVYGAGDGGEQTVTAMLRDPDSP